ncbi:DNA-binding IclR family transcriptional regulator [Caldalkalibacillus uzonensis]|uniref:DNA-binding IclR family transcriptional regulator n=1 Tax=Caldalkalibacillus uzonensis TaxID=353224 RepID=A0ABU0CN61_9BACI|nr:IclR family transcriptional regulator [Caldalkalibacillus uzonensis]MDQ0337853.1 DNA-binding IclR family transcriptional regulator [Caldalkalibacillus uzonensis]
MNGSQTLIRALDILFVLAEADSTLSVSEIAEKVSIPESTAYRLLHTLEQNGIVERKGKGKIGLGLRILDLARGLQQQIDRELYVIARPFMEQLTKVINETSILAVRTGFRAICIQNVESQRLIRLAIENGRTLPLHQGASGKAILAFESKKVLHNVLSMLPTNQEQEKLLKDLDDIRAKGYCITLGEVDKDVFGIAAPIFDYYKRVIASLTIAGPANRLAKEEMGTLINQVTTTAQQISEKISRLHLEQ